MDWLTQKVLERIRMRDDAQQVLGDSEEAQKAIEELEAARVKSRVSGGLVVKSKEAPPEDWLVQFVQKAQQPKPQPGRQPLFDVIRDDVERQRLARAEEAHKKAVAEKPFWAMIADQGGKR